MISDLLAHEVNSAYVKPDTERRCPAGPVVLDLQLEEERPAGGGGSFETLMSLPNNARICISTP